MHTSSKSIRPPAALVRIWKQGYLFSSLVTLGVLLACPCDAAEDEKSSEAPKNGTQPGAASSQKGKGKTSGAAKASETAKPATIPVESKVSDPAPLPPPVQTDAPVPPDPSLVPELMALPDPNLAPEVQADPTRNREAAPEETDRKPKQNEEAGGGGGKPESFTIPGFYGQAPTTFTTGTGRLALPKFRSSLSLGVGYDDNPQTQTQSFDSEESDGGSAFASLNYSASYQKARHREVFLWDGHAGGNIYSQNADPSYDISLGMSYQRRFVRPFTLSANLSLSYSNQDQYGQQGYVRTREGEEDEGSSGSLNASANVIFGARWSPQFSTSTTLSASTALYGGTREESDGLSLTFGQDFRYRVDRYAFVADVRYETSTYQNANETAGSSDSDTIYLLAGVEWRLGPLFISTRFGESLRSYADGGTSADPYGELAVSFSPNVQNSFTLSTRYGLESNAAGEGDSTTFRVGLSYSRVFTSRLNGSLSLNYSDSSETVSGSSTSDNSFEGERIFDATLVFNYRLSSRISLSASATCTRGSGGESSGLSDPDRNSVQVNAVYQF